MKILDVELEDFDFNDADDLERYEKAVEKTQKKLDNMSDKDKKASEIIREGCGLIFDCFNEIFGAGTAEKVFGPKTSLRTCTQAFRDLKDEREEQGRGCL